RGRPASLRHSASLHALAPRRKKPPISSSAAYEPRPKLARHMLQREEAAGPCRRRKGLTADMTAFVNNMKTVLLLGGLTGLLVGIGALLGQQFILPFLIMAIAMNLGVWFFSDKLAIASMGAQEVDARTGGEYYRIVEELARRAQLPMPRVYISPHQAPNAFATGRSPSKAAVCVTQGALQLLNREELEGVIGHELAHIKNRDTLTATIAASVAGALASIAQWGFLLGGGQN